MRGGQKDESAFVLTRDVIDTVDKYPDETDFKKSFEANIPGFKYDYAFKDIYTVQGTINGCDGPVEEDKDFLRLFQ